MTRLHAEFWIGWATFAVVVALVTGLEIGNELNILAALKVAPPTWQAWTNGWSSVIALCVIYPGVRLLADRARPGKARLWKIAAIQVPAAAAFCGLHYLGYSLIRVGVYRAFGSSYAIGSDPFLYEAARDLAAYAVIVAIIWTARAFWEHSRAAARPPVAGPTHFDIRDGARVIRVATGDILAVSSAGNYVEFHLADGRKPLMRATLATIETQLKAQGFSRTHRSWLANTARVAEIAPTGAGDFTLSLQGGLQIPLSRRFREAFESSAPACEATR